MSILGGFDPDGELKAGQPFVFRNLGGLKIRFDSCFYYDGPVLAPISEGPRSSRAEVERCYLTPLAKEMDRQFPDISRSVHPSLTDLRPFMRLGWKLYLHYTHVWDFKKNPDIWPCIRRDEQKKIKKGHRFFTLQQEEWKTIGEDFVRLHQKCMQRKDWLPNDHWNRIFSDRVGWMEDRNMTMIITARDERKQIAGAQITILGREFNTAYFWRVCYDPEQASLGIDPAICYACYESMPDEITSVDWADGMEFGQSVYKDRMGTELIPYMVITPPRSKEQLINYARSIRRNALQSVRSLFS
jgi:hypothetical protein